MKFLALLTTILFSPMLWSQSPVHGFVLSTLNQKIQDHGGEWIAADTSVSGLSMSQKKPS